MDEREKKCITGASYLFLSLFSSIFLCFCLEYSSHCCSCNHIGYVIRQFQLDSFDMYYLSRCADSTLRSLYAFLSTFFFLLSCDAWSHAITLFYSFVVVHRSRFASSHFDQVNEWVFRLLLMYRFPKPSVNRHLQIEIEVCCCLLYLISLEHFKTTNSFFLLDTIIYIYTVVWQIPFFFLQTS